MPNFTFSGGRKQARKNFFSFYLNLSAVPKKFTYIFTFSLNWNKHAKKTQIHFNSDVFAVIGVVDAKAPMVS